ncbi:hypothetical protein DFH06DRAFT_1344033 [Mycena polygramma]|nr:hypothetical protein DFH06DRAFT_1344033 [Mycena polygramma]
MHPHCLITLTRRLATLHSQHLEPTSAFGKPLSLVLSAGLPTAAGLPLPQFRLNTSRSTRLRTGTPSLAVLAREHGLRRSIFTRHTAVTSRAVRRCRVLAVPRLGPPALREC